METFTFFPASPDFVSHPYPFKPGSSTLTPNSTVESLLEGLKPSIVSRLADPEGKGTTRIIFSTPMAESAVAGYLTELAAKVAPKGVKVGSYPRWGKQNNSVTLVGRDKEYLESLVDEVEKNIQGKRVLVEGEDDQAEKTS